VALAVVLFPVSNEAVALQPAALDALARLGVTSVSLVRDDETAGLVLEAGHSIRRGRRRRPAQSPARVTRRGRSSR
jgi:hypothetical protein